MPLRTDAPQEKKPNRILIGAALLALLLLPAAGGISLWATASRPDGLSWGEWRVVMSKTSRYPVFDRHLRIEGELEQWQFPAWGDRLAVTHYLTRDGRPPNYTVWDTSTRW